MTFTVFPNRLLPVVLALRCNYPIFEIIVRSADQIGKFRITVAPEGEKAFYFVRFLLHHPVILPGRLFRCEPGQPLPHIGHQHILKQPPVQKQVGYTGLRVEDIIQQVLVWAQEHGHHLILVILHGGDVLPLQSADQGVVILGHRQGDRLLPHPQKPQQMVFFGGFIPVLPHIADAGIALVVIQPIKKTIAKKFGWTLTTKHTKTQKSLDEGIADIKAGRVREVSTDELKQMMGL